MDSDKIAAELQATFDAMEARVARCRAKSHASYCFWLAVAVVVSCLVNVAVVLVLR